MRSLILSQCRDLRICVIREDLGATVGVKGLICKTVLYLLEGGFI